MVKETMILQIRAKKLSRKVKEIQISNLSINKLSNKGELENSNKKRKNRSKLQSVMKSLKSTLKFFRNQLEKSFTNFPFKDRSK